MRAQPWHEQDPSTALGRARLHHWWVQPGRVTLGTPSLVGVLLHPPVGHPPSQPHGGAGADPCPRQGPAAAAASSGAGFLWRRLLSCFIGDESGAINMRVDRGGAGSALCLHAGVPAAGRGGSAWPSQWPGEWLPGPGQAGTPVLAPRVMAASLVQQPSSVAPTWQGFGWPLPRDSCPEPQFQSLWWLWVTPRSGGRHRPRSICQHWDGNTQWVKDTGHGVTQHMAVGSWHTANSTRRLVQQVARSA